MKYEMEISTQEQIQFEMDNPYYWIVRLVNGCDPEMGGVILETKLITKKYERVEAVINGWKELIETGQCYVTVQQMAAVKVETYSI